MPIPELLAPAGSYDTFVVAVNAGADAVYISGERFGARAFAKNFSIDEIEKAVEYAHLNGVKVHVTVNTLINNFEIVDVVRYLFKLYKIGVDAVIVQDLGIIELIKNLIPDLEVHASTQMTLSDYNCVLWAVENGISRIVFPREISVDKIAEIHNRLEEAGLEMELEVFGHGALCYCFSGNCYISSYNSGRSGNRGACAQPCRKQYKLKYKNYNVGNGFLLSTHDLAVYKGLDKLDKAGVYSLKLEGRMKSSDYVGTIVNAYRHLIDGVQGDEKEKYEQDLSLVFNRQFTDGYILNQKPGEVLGRESSGHEGVYIGKISSKKGETIIIDKENKENKINLNIGDGIGFKYKDKIKGIYIDNIIEQTDDYIKLDTTRNVREGDKVFLSYSKTTHDELKKFNNNLIKQHIPISLDISWNDKLNLIITAKFEIENNVQRFNYISEIQAEKAEKRPISEEDIIKQLSKTGDTPFYIENIEIKNMPDNIFIPIGKLNKIRRNLLDKAIELLLDYYKPNKEDIRETRKITNKFIREYNSYGDIQIKNEDLALGAFIDNIELLKLAQNLPIKNYYFDPSFSFNSQEEYFENIEYLLEEAYEIVDKKNKKNKTNSKQENNNSNQSNLILVLSSFISDEEIEKISTIIESLKEKDINIPIMYDTPGISKSFNENKKNNMKTKIYGNHNLNVWNSYNVKNLSDSGFDSVMVSGELSNEEIKELVSKYQYIKDKDVDTEISMIVQGNLEVMSSKDDFSNLNEGRDFIINDSSDYAILEDQKRKKFKYKVVFDYNKHSHFINKDCLCLISDLELIKEIGIDTIIVDCRFSSPKYSSTILSLYAQALKINKVNKDYDLYIFREQIESLTLSRLNKGNFVNGRLHEN
ncbi:MAG: U32 family peptidase [Methanobacteriaceae archaeon]|nr:U32 family peptidase [Methanobacteriaceae archaeon]